MQSLVDILSKIGNKNKNQNIMASITKTSTRTHVLFRPSTEVSTLAATDSAEMDKGVFVQM